MFKKIDLSSKTIEFLCVHIFGKGMNLEFGLESIINELSLGVLLYLKQRQDEGSNLSPADYPGTSATSSE